MRGRFYLTRKQALSLFAYFTKEYSNELTVEDMQWANGFMISENLEYSVFDNFGNFVLRNKIQITDYEDWDNCKCKK